MSYVYDETDWPTFSPTTESPTTSAPSFEDREAKCVGLHGWHTDRKTNAGCTNDSNIVKNWLHGNIKSQMFYATAKECCMVFFAGEECVIRDNGCGDYHSTTPPTARPTLNPVVAAASSINGDSGSCSTYGWHVDRDNQGGCSNNDDIPPSWIDQPHLLEKYVFPTAKACCDRFFPGKECSVVDCNGDGAGSDGNDASGSGVEPLKENCSEHGWHVDRSRNDGCTDDDNIIQGWLMNPEVTKKMFHPTAEACCEAIFPNKKCEIYDTGCYAQPAGAPVDQGPAPPVPSPATPEPTGNSPASECSEHGWHVDRIHNDGCTDNNDIIDGWLINPEFKARMFHPTVEACCEQFFPGKPCEIYDTGCLSQPATEPPDPAPTPPVPSPEESNPDQSSAPVEPPAPSCSENGWHIHRLNNDGCSDDGDILQGWLLDALKDKMFHPTAESCCEQFYKGKDCKIYDNGCSQPAPAPVPEETAVPTPASPATPFSGEDFEVGDLSETMFTTDGLPWVITDEVSVSGSKSVKNSITTRGQSSRLKLSMNFPSNGVLAYELRHDVFMPWAILQVERDGEIVEGFPGHSGDVKWSTETVRVTKGQHEIVWDVLTKDMAMPPTKRGSGTVWVDDVRFLGTLFLDFEDDKFDDNIVSFSGIGKWKIDDSMPSSATGLSAHSPRGLLPGEHSTMEIRYTAPIGGGISFDCNMGLGTFSFYVDDKLEFTASQPGQGTQEVIVPVSPGEHTFSWKYEPPSHANMPMSMVWIDNIAFDL